MRSSIITDIRDYVFARATVHFSGTTVPVKTILPRHGARCGKFRMDRGQHALGLGNDHDGTGNGCVPDNSNPRAVENFGDKAGLLHFFGACFHVARKKGPWHFSWNLRFVPLKRV